MNCTKAIMILASLLTIKSTIGQPNDCYCSRSSGGSCQDPGCSNGTNSHCNDGSFDSHPYNGDLYYIVDYSLFIDISGCSCPYNPSNATHNGYANLGLGFSGYNYINCTGFGGNAPHDSGGLIPAHANAAVDCCNFCCNRTDPHPIPTTVVTSGSD